jgi:ribonuclease P/MRP protein subunit RPP40
MATLMLKELASELKDILTIIFTRSMAEGKVPEDWRSANITPIFKKGRKCEAGNYRPVSLTSHVCKVLESIIKDSIVEHLNKNELLNETQHGFRSKRSCLTNLLIFMEKVSDYVDQGCPVDVVYLDFQKAFDKVPHERLLLKIGALGIGGEVVNWIRAWLRDRKQRVVVSGESSDWSAVTSGVPQGSVLGPILFIMFINDIEVGVCSNVLKFADDTKLFGKVGSEENCKQLRADLRRLYNWSIDWQMLFNLEKCKIMHFGYNNPKNTFLLGSQILDSVKEEKDLGVLITDDLKVSNQCVKVVKTANQVLGMIKRTFTFKTTDNLLQLYKSLVRPHLEYCMQVWCPYLRKDIDMIEGVQRKATRMILGYSEKSYEERLKCFIRISNRWVRRNHRLKLDSC